MRFLIPLIVFATSLSALAISWDDSPTAAFTASTVCQGLPTVFTNNSTTLSGTVVANIWDFGDGEGSSVSSPSHIYANSGIYSVTLTVINSQGDVDDANVFVNVYPSGNLNYIFSAGTQCVEANFNFTNLSNPISGSFISTLWDFGDGSTSSNSNPVHTFSNYGKFNVTLTQVTNNDCVNSITETVEVYPLPIVEFQAQNACQGQPISFINENQLAFGTSSFQWDFGDGSQSNLENPQHQFPTSKTYSVTLSVTTDHGCVSSISHNVSVHPLPVADFSTSDHCVDSDAIFNNSSSISSGSLVYEWIFGNDTYSTSINPVIKYAAAGNYQVSLRAVSDMGCEANTSKNVGVYAKPIVDFTIGDVCLGSPSQFLNNSFIGQGDLTYVWDFGDGTAGNQTMPQHFYSSEGSYSVTLSATSQRGCQNIKTLKHKVNPRPSAEFSAPSHCLGTNIPITNLSTVSSGSLSFSWNFGDGSSSGLQEPFHQYQSFGNYSITLSISTDYGCTDVVAREVYVHSIPNINFTFENICEGSSAQFLNISSIPQGELSYQWDFGDGFASTDTNPAHVYTSDDDYRVKLTATTPFGCSRELTKSITVYATPIAAFLANDVCLSDPVSIITMSSVANGILSYQWSFGDGSASLNATPVHQYIQFGNYNIELLVRSENGCSATTERNIIVHPLPNVDFTLSDICSGTSMQVINNSFSAEGPLAFKWDFGDGITSNATNPTKTYGVHGNYNISLKASTPFGCSVSLTKPITVFAQPTANFSVSDHCFGTDAVFTNESTILSGNLNFRWDFGNGTSSSDPNPVKVYETVGNFLVTLQATSQDNCSSTIQKNIYVYPRPIADFAAKNVCDGETVEFVNSSAVTTGSLLFVWNFGDGITSTDHSAEHLYSGPNSYNVSLQVTSPFGNCSTTVKRDISVYPKPKASFAASDDCLDSLIRFDNKTVYEGTSINYEWSFGDGVTSQLTSPTHLYSIAQTYSVSLKAQASNGCTDSFSRNIFVFAKPSLNFFAENVCDTTPVQFRNFSTIASGTLSYDWEFGDGSTSTNDRPFHKYPLDGLYRVKLKAISDKGCVGFGETTITVYPLPISNFIVQDVCNGLPAHFENRSEISSGTIRTFLWDFGDKTNSILDNPIKEYLNSGLYNVRLTATSDKNCQAVLEKRIQVYTQPLASFSVDDVCFLENAIFKNTSSISDGTVTFQWKFGDGTTSNATSPSHLYDSYGLYTTWLHVTSTNNCKDSVSKPVLIFPLPHVTAGDDKIVSQGYGTTLQAYGADEYSWQPIDGLDNSTIANPIARPLETTLYRVTATDSHGCANSDSVLVTVNKEFKLVASNVLTPDDNGKNDSWVIENVETFGDAFVRVFDRWGNLVYEKEGYRNDWRGESDDDILPDGTYYYYVTFNSSDKVYKGALTILRNRKR